MMYCDCRLRFKNRGNNVLPLAIELLFEIKPGNVIPEPVAVSFCIGNTHKILMVYLQT